MGDQRTIDLADDFAALTMAAAIQTKLKRNLVAGSAKLFG